MTAELPDHGPTPALMALQPVSRARGGDRASDRVFAALSHAIRDNRLLPGSALSETELAKQLHVSRTPLREAIARLVDHGLVQVTPQVGTRVSLISMHDVEQARFVRENLEVAAFTAGCALAERDVTQLRAFIREQKAAARSKNLDAFFEADEAMHQEIFAMSGYPGAWSAVHRMKMHLDRLRRLSLPDPATLAALIDEHNVIVDSLESGNAETGCATVRRHARRVVDKAPALRERHPDYFLAQ